MRRCPKCQETLPREAFAKSSKRKVGLQAYCRECQHPKDTCACGGQKDARSAQCSTCRRAAFKAKCHIDRRHFAKGKCKRCYLNDRQRGAVSRRYQLKFYFGLSQEQYNQMLQGQGGVCAICHSPEPGGQGAWHVDHDHACCPGKRSCGTCVRGLLCLQCNHLLGNSREDILILESAIRYIKVG